MAVSRRELHWKLRKFMKTNGTRMSQPIVWSRMECGNSFWSVRTGQVTKGQVWFRCLAYQCTCNKVLIFKQFQGAQTLLFFVKIGMQLPFTEQTKKYKCNIWVLKTTILDPRKSAFLVFKEKLPTNFFLPVSALIQL